MCLEACPTYRLTGLETESPRGRIHLMQALVEGRAEPAADLTVHLDRCLACRACETACPSGVPYGRLIESTRSLLAVERTRSLVEKALRWLVFRWLLPNPAHVDAAAAFLALYERTGLRRLIRSSGLVRALPHRLRALEGLQPRFTGSRFSLERGGVIHARGTARGRVALLTGCVMRVAYGDVHEASAQLLSRAGYEVIVPATQTCCGALHAHAGEHVGARELARRNIAAFEIADVRWIVVNAAGCGSQMKEYSALLADDPAWTSQAQEFAAKVRDLSEVLMEAAERIPLGPLALRVTYQDPCHLAHAQGIRAEPRAMLRRIPGLELVEMRGADGCCGSAGTYNVVQPGYAERVLEAKIADVLATCPQAVVTANPGCMLQLRYGLERLGAEIPVYHLAQVLEMSASQSAEV